MPKIVIKAKSLKVELSASEKIWAMHGDLDIASENILGAEPLNPRWWKTLGLRIPGTALPGLIVAGTYLARGDRVFVYWTRKKQPLQINLHNHGYNRLIVGVDDADAWADAINAAIVSC
jgi:hypothetical protein